MERIRVDTDELKAQSKVFETSAGVYAQAGNEIMSLVAGLPSYDGQLSGPARATALEINRQCQDLSAGYKSDADSLVRIAKAFEDVDDQAITAFNENQAVLESNMPGYKAMYSPVPKTKGGNAKFGYEYLSGNYVVIWCNGYYLRVNLSVPPLSTEDYQKVMKFINDVDQYDTDLKKIPVEMSKIVEDACFTILAAIFTATPASLAAAAIAFYKLKDEIGDAIDIWDNINAMKQKTTDIADDFVGLFGTDDPGFDGRVSPTTP